MWMEPRSGLRLARIASDGSHADGAGISIELPDTGETGAVAWDGNEWVIAYPTRAGVQLRTMTHDGVLSPATLIPSFGGVFRLRLASDNNGHFAVIWETGQLIRVSIDGALPVDLTHQVNAHPDVTWASGAFRMVWMNYEYRGAYDPPVSMPYPAATGITFATMNRNGVVSIDGLTQTDSDQQPRVAGNFSMLVTDGLKVRRDGDEIALNTTASVTAPPAFAVDDDGHALFVSPGGRAVLIGPGGAQPFVAAQDAGSPDVVWTRNGWMLVYTRVVDEAPYNHVQRVFVKTLDVSPARRRP
jgi:hypothetical protein